MNTRPTPGPWFRGVRVSETHVIRILSRDGMLVAAASGAGGPWAEVAANAALIVAAVNACFKVNPDNPLAVAEALPELAQVCREALAFLLDPKGWEKAHNPKGEFLPNMLEAVLAKLETRP